MTHSITREDLKKDKPLRLPEWFKASRGKLQATKELSQKLETEVPNSICQEARCPNRSECFAKGVLTFMIMGIVCTRNCAFCSVAHGKPLPVNDEAEAQKILSAIKKLDLRFVVLTSPNRDDLENGGAEHYAYIVRRIKEEHPEVKVEILIPDFQGSKPALEIAMAAMPDVVNHNVETVPELYHIARRGSLYKRSMEVLNNMKYINPRILTKTGVMVGLGETPEQLVRVFEEAARNRVDILTIGQYLKPDRNNLDVQKYYHPDEFAMLKEKAEQAGIRYVFSGPLVRSSYLAEHVFEDLTIDQRGSSDGHQRHCTNH